MGVTKSLSDWLKIGGVVGTIVGTVLTAGWSYMYTTISVQNSKLQYSYFLATHQDIVEINKQFEKINSGEFLKQTDKDALHIRCSRVSLLETPFYDVERALFFSRIKASENCKKLSAM